MTTTADPVETVEQPTAARRFPLLPARMRPRNRPRLLLELAFTVALYLAYSRTRRYVPREKTAALHRAREVLHFERLLHVNFELSLNHAVARVDWLTVGMNYYYATLHFAVTPAVLIWLYARRPQYYRAARTALYTATCLALVGFTFFALAPPRFLIQEGFIDTIVSHHTHGSWDSGHVSTVSNQYAAMPSVHIVWSAWCGLTLFFLARWTWLRVLGVCYPLATFVVIISTANHFFADAVAGAATLCIGFLLQRLLFGRPAYPRRGLGRGEDASLLGPSALGPDEPSGTAAAVEGASRWGKRNSVRLR
ncbi:PAP2 superfamily protein [Actinacidiphila yanglinensis]|uniref:PAP2 superfamily protein n=1 Tax=Actinacidiphila yanglinensis TaxID=310779 RepID=A0A1H6DW68_9ACTN|nr:PAP2 superfamily protein [Actinacidiphila yanglinensis]